MFGVVKYWCGGVLEEWSIGRMEYWKSVRPRRISLGLRMLE